MKNLLIPVIILIQSLCCHAQSKVANATMVTFKRLKNTFSFPKEGIDEILDPVNHNAFFYGETHTKNFEPQFKYNYITYLNQRNNVSDVFMEVGYSAAVIFNEYLITGDTNLLHLDILYTSPFYMEMWKQLYTYNKTLSSDRQLRIHGVDFESPKTFYSALLILSSQQMQVPSTLEKIFKDIAMWATWDSKQVSKFHVQNQKKIRAIFERHEDDVFKLYGSNAATIYKIVRNYHFSMMDRSREKWMYTNLLKEINETKIKKFVAFFGGDHVNYTNPTALSVKLGSLAQFKDGISTIRMFCFNAVDNWSKETLECIGTYDIEKCRKLRKTYMNDKGVRAVLLKNNNTLETFIKGTADAYLFAEDN